MKHLKWTMVFLVFLILAGCTSASNISTDQVKAFIKDTKHSQESLQDVDVQFRPTQIEIIYILKANIDEADRLELFTKANALVNSEQFDQEAIQGQFLQKYKSDGYPKLAILFDVNDDGEYDVQYTADYHKDKLNTSNGTSYSQWYYHKDMATTGELVP
ncbi:hypothetical protein [Paenibacillus sp. CMAA1364]